MHQKDDLTYNIKFENSPDDEHFIAFGRDVLFCFVIVFFYFLYNLFLESKFVLWSDGSIQLCQFNFHSWQFDRLFVPKLVYHETLFLQLKILSKLDGTEQIREKNRRSFHLQILI